MDPTEVAEYTAWWVHTPNNGKRVVHIPLAHAQDYKDATDTDVEPEPEPLCSQYRNRRGQEWTVSSTAVLPPGWRPVCERCESALKKTLSDKSNTTINK